MRTDTIRALILSLLAWVATAQVACKAYSTPETAPSSETRPPVESALPPLTLDDAQVPPWWAHLPEQELSEADVREAMEYQAPEASILQTRIHFLLSPEADQIVSDRYEAMASQRRAEQEREAERLANMPRTGALIVLTTPQYGLVEVDGVQRMAPNPRDSGTLIETRSGSATEVDVTVPHTAIVRQSNYQTETIEVIPFGQPGSQWQQNRQSGTFLAEVRVQMTPEPHTEAELTARTTPSDDTAQLKGEITIRSNPSGAAIIYNGHVLLTDNGQPLTTPATFSRYTTSIGELDVELDPRGLPIRLELEGHAAFMTGVYAHMFTCSPLDDVDPSAPFWQHCVYQYDTGEIELTSLDVAQAQHPGLGPPRFRHNPSVDSAFGRLRQNRIDSEAPIPEGELALPPGGSGRVLRTGTIDTGR